MRIKKRTFTLLEALIAIALTSLILVSVMSLFREISQASRVSEGLQQETFRLRYLENRLSQIFPKTVGFTNKKDVYFFTSSNPPGLFLSYDNGGSKQKELSNTVLGRFFLDPQHNRFYLATWPSPERWIPGALPPIKLEVLMEDVHEVNWSFFVPPDKNWKPKLAGAAPQAPTPQGRTQTGQAANAPPIPNGAPSLKPSVDGEWTNEWSQEYKLLPGLVRLQLKGNGNNHMFIFPLSQTERQIVYSQ